jgi:hypothetical protein
MAIASAPIETLHNPPENDSSQTGRGVRRGVLPRLSACLAAPIAIATTLAWANPSAALPRGGPPPPPDCIGDITSRLAATPSSIDRDMDGPLVTTLTWSVNVPKGCPITTNLTLANSPVPKSGSRSFTLTTSTTFSLVLTSGNLHATLATIRVPVAGDPGFITVSAGRQLTADDITKFNEQWMQPFEIAGALNFATSTLGNRDPDGVWATGERMAAMVRMFERTHDARYLNHLRALNHIALQFRDDLPFDGPAVVRPLEQIRNKVGVPAWGGDGGRPDVEGVEYGGLHHIEEIVTSLYAYPIATFARIVAEDPSLQKQYGDDAIDDANRIFETVLFLLPQVKAERIGDFVEAHLIQPEEFLNRPTPADCDKAFNQAMYDHPDDASRWTQQHNDCKLKQALAGRDLPHNINLAFSMTLIELARAIGTPFYQQSPKRSPVAAARQDELLLAAIRQQRYFSNHLHDSNLSNVPNICLAINCWNYQENLPSGHNPHAEDLDHGAIDMSYLEESLQNYGLLYLAAQRFKEPLALGPQDWARFAATFLVNTQGTNFKHDIVGHDESPPYVANSRCEGWVTLARQRAPQIYQTCHDVTLRIVDGAQPYLNIGNHSSLLATKQFGPPP